MSAKLDDRMRATFAGIADILIPEAESMPSASSVDVHGPVVDRILGLRPDLSENFLRGLKSAAGQEPGEAARALNQSDPAALGAIGLVAAAAYYMNPTVRERLGYPGQEKRLDDPDATPEYVTNGMLDHVIKRGSIYRPTPK
jgi:hypothetical protein